MDDVVESVLGGFGPDELTRDDSLHISPSTRDYVPDSAMKQKSWIGNALGRKLSQALGAVAKVGNNRALEVPLKKSIDQAIDSAIGKKMSVEDIEAKIATLQKQLKEAKLAEAKMPLSPIAAPTPSPTNGASYVLSPVEDEDKENGSYMNYLTACNVCGIGA